VLHTQILSDSLEKSEELVMLHPNSQVAAIFNKSPTRVVCAVNFALILHNLKHLGGAFTSKRSKSKNEDSIGVWLRPSVISVVYPGIKMLHAELAG
jgi:hypothetical protein